MPTASTKKSRDERPKKKLLGKGGEIYRASVNLNGLYALKPVLCRWKPDTYSDSGGAFWDSRGDADAKASWPDGQTVIPRGDAAYIVFASRDKQRVEDWIAGARAVLTRLHEFAGSAFE